MIAEVVKMMLVVLPLKKCSVYSIFIYNLYLNLFIDLVTSIDG